MVDDITIILAYLKIDPSKQFANQTHADHAALMDDAAQLGAWLQVDMTIQFAVFQDGRTGDLPAWKAYVENSAAHPGVWGYYVADDGVANVTSMLELLAALPPLKVVTKAQAGTVSRAIIAASGMHSSK